MPPGIFVDPAWDMLLDLFAARAEKSNISVSSACVASGVPASTALRWLSELERLGLVIRTRDERDGRRSFVRISDEAAIEMECWLNATFMH